ncbi:MAG: 6-phosphogluconolactonase [Bdellovibrionales bacterium]|nr:6-phosphogluconolactonase [Bdellovibrionales bacterium]
MKLVVCKGLEDWVLQAHDWCDQAAKSGCHSFYLPAGATPIPLYQHWTQIRPSFLDQSHFIQLDDVITSPHHGLFRKFFDRELPYWKGRFFRDEKYHQGDAAVLGLGLNGHIGFHEPGLEKALFQACVPLESETCDNLKIPQGCWGVTYGLQSILAARRVLLLVRGQSKGPILRKILSGGTDSPAADLVRLHPNILVLADQKSYTGP